MKALHLTNGEVITLIDNFRRCPASDLEQIKCIYQDGSEGWAYSADLEFEVNIETKENWEQIAEVFALNEQQAESILQSYLGDNELGFSECHYHDSEKGTYYFKIV